MAAYYMCRGLNFVSINYNTYFFSNQNIFYFLLLFSFHYQYNNNNCRVWLRWEEGLTREKDNHVVIRLCIEHGLGRITPDKEYKIFNDEAQVRLDGKWYYKVAARCKEIPEHDFINWHPMGLYNAMTAPCQDTFLLFSSCTSTEQKSTCSQPVSCMIWIVLAPKSPIPTTFILAIFSGSV